MPHGDAPLCNPIPVLSDLQDELEYYQDDNEQVVAEARLAATKLRSWVNDGVYANLFDRHTNLTAHLALGLFQHRTAQVP